MALIREAEPCKGIAVNSEVSTWHGNAEGCFAKAWFGTVMRWQRFSFDAPGRSSEWTGTGIAQNRIGEVKHGTAWA